MFESYYDYTEEGFLGGWGNIFNGLHYDKVRLN